MREAALTVAVAAAAAIAATVVIAPAVPGPAAQPAVDTTIVIRATGSTLFFEPERISVKNGKRVRIRFVNAGTLPHNIVFARDEKDIDSLAVAALLPSATDYVPLSKKERMIAYSALASPGQTVEFIFIVPPPGEYPYVCLTSGHANTMLGTLRSLR